MSSNTKIEEAKTKSKETKIKNIRAKMGDNYDSQINYIESILPMYYFFLYNEYPKTPIYEKEIYPKSSEPYPNINMGIYIPTSEDIKKINSNLMITRRNTGIENFSLQYLDEIKTDDYVIKASIDSIKYLSNKIPEWTILLAPHHRTIRATISYSERSSALSNRCELLEHIYINASRNECSKEKIMEFFNGKNTNNPLEQIRELSCMLQNIINRRFPGFYIKEEIHELFKLVTRNPTIKYSQIKNYWHKFPAEIKRVLPNPYMDIPELLKSNWDRCPTAFEQN